MTNITRIRNLDQEATLDDNVLFPVDKSTYTSSAKYAKLSDIVDYVQTGSAAYINADVMPETVGGIEAGSSFTSPGYTLQEMWTKLLYPYQYPAFASFFINGKSVSNEIGLDFGSGTFRWTTSNSTNVSGKTIEISGWNLPTISNLSNDGIESVTFTSDVTRDSSDDYGTRAWTIQGLNTNGDTFSDTYTMRWDWRWYWGTSTNTVLIESQIKALANNNLYSSYSRTYSFVGGGYKYLCFADTYSGPSNFVDADTGFGVAMYGGYGNTQNGYTYDFISVTNSNAETTNYRVYRTQNTITDAIDITVS